MGRAEIALFLIPILFISGCTPGFRKGCRDTLCGPDVKIISFHLSSYYHCIEELVNRLYAKNPRYEPDVKRREMKLAAIFGHDKNPFPVLEQMASHELLKEAFSPRPMISDRVFLLGLGLKKGIDEAYDTGGSLFLTGCQIELERLQRLYSNLAQVNWRMKTYKDSSGKLLFITNEAGENGYINMGFEVIMTQMLTRIQDDIYLRGGLEKNLVFRLSAIFISII